MGLFSALMFRLDNILGSFHNENMKNYQVKIDDVNIGVRANSIKEAQEKAKAKVRVIKEAKKAKDDGDSKPVQAELAKIETKQEKIK